MHPNETKLTYFLSSKKGILIVSLIGPLNRANAPVFEQCIKEVQKADARWVVVNFRDVPNIVDRQIFPVFVRMQKAVRDKPAELRLSGLHPDLLETLGEQGLIRGNEVAMNLAAALQSLSFNKNKEAEEPSEAPPARPGTPPKSSTAA